MLTHLSLCISASKHDHYKMVALGLQVSMDFHQEEDAMDRIQLIVDHLESALIMAPLPCKYANLPLPNNINL
jgi:hypothetical protein